MLAVLCTLIHVIYYNFLAIGGGLTSLDPFSIDRLMFMIDTY